jgi:hypothetical protein
MYQICPKCAYQRRPDDTSSPDICPGCGLVFSKWEQHQAMANAVPKAVAVEPRETLRERLFYVPPRTEPAVFWGRAALFAIFLIWGWRFILMGMDPSGIGRSFMHHVNLVFHEAGHVIFRPFGEFMTVLGGSLGQLLMPAVVTGALVVKNRDNFGASLGLWWLSQSLMDLAPYINDARALQLPLLGGGTGADRPGVHDWENILLDLGLIQHDHAIAAAVHALGVLGMLTAFGWGGYLLYLQYRDLGDSGADA